MWSERDVWLIGYPDQFAGPGPPLRALDAVITGLGPEINGVHVLPFHPASSDGGFSVMDHALVDPSHGTWTDVAALCAHHRVMADAVVNHVSAQGTWFGEFLAGDPARQSFFRVIAPGTDLSRVVRPRAGPPVARVAHRDGPVDVWATFGADQIDLDYRDPDVLLAMFDAVFRYVDHGAAAVRLDAVGFLWKDPDRTSAHLPETHALVALLRSCLDELAPGVLLITETNVAHADNVAYLGAPAQPEAHAVYQFSLPPLVLHAVVSGDAAPLARWAAQAAPPAGTTVLNFLASHDGVGLRPAAGWLDDAARDALVVHCEAVGGVVNRAVGPGGEEEPYELAATWWALCGRGDEAATLDLHIASHAVALALQGLPLLYIHSLVGSDNDVVTAARTGLGRDLNRARFADGEAFLERLSSAETRAGRIWSALRPMLHWRTSHAAFHPESPQHVDTDGRGLLVVRRGRAPDEALVAVNFGEETTELALPAGSWAPFDDSHPLDGPVPVGPRQARWFHRIAVSPS